MAPPPSQKGKFKPRKPAKTIRPGAPAGTGGAGSADADAATLTSGPTVAFAPSTDNNMSRGDRGSAGFESSGGRGGRGGRGRGRGRGRAPIPSGRVVFTGNEKSSSTGGTRRSSGGGKSSALGSSKNKDMETEEVVGQLEVGIGTGKEKKSATGDKNSAELGSMDYDQEPNERDNNTETNGKGASLIDGFVYDSDSSNDEGSTSTSKQHSKMPPLELPFPSQPFPLGVGPKDRPVAYDNQRLANSTNEAGGPVVAQELTEPAISPFVDAQEAGHLSWEQNSWFLVQLPTRLPPLQPRTADGPATTFSMDHPMDDGRTNDDSNQPPSISEVATPPVAAKTHDSILANTAAGRIGKIIVYKSGKTVLKMEGPDGSSPILLDVNEGLSCSFLQHAVVIDAEESKFVALGTVSKSIVATPDFSSSFADSSSIS